MFGMPEPFLINVSALSFLSSGIALAASQMHLEDMGFIYATSESTSRTSHLFSAKQQGV